MTQAKNRYDSCRTFSTLIHKVTLRLAAGLKSSEAQNIPLGVHLSSVVWLSLSLRSRGLTLELTRSERAKYRCPTLETGPRKGWTFVGLFLVPTRVSAKNSDCSHGPGCRALGKAGNTATIWGEATIGAAGALRRTHSGSVHCRVGGVVRGRNKGGNGCSPPTSE